MCCTVLGIQTRVRRYTEKENLDTRNCYKCFYQGEFLFLMGWVLSSFIYQVKFWYFVDDLNEQLIEAEQISALDSCSDPLVSSALSIVSRDFVHPSNDNLTIVIIIAPICILLWVLLWHSNANFVLEQRDLVDQHFPPGGAAGGGGGAPLPALPEPEPPKPKSDAVV